MNHFTSAIFVVKRIADSTVRRLSAYLQFLEDSEDNGQTTISSTELATRGGTTSAQVRKDLSFFGSFGKRGLGYSVAELKGRLREILGLAQDWKVIIVGAGKIGAALAHYREFHERGFFITAAFDSSPAKIGKRIDDVPVYDVAKLEEHIARDAPDIVVLAVPGDQAQAMLDRVVRCGVKAVLTFAPTQLHAPPDVAVKAVNMATELEGLTFSLTNR